MIDLAPGMQIDRYEVVGAIGEGGMAAVYHVRHTRLGSDHVLKVLSLPGRNVRDRLLREGQIQAKLKHRNVVEVTDVIDIQGAPGLVMELVRGPPLDDVVAAERLPLDIVEMLVPGILAGVAAAHQEGVVHRDLKPANILLSVRRGRVVPKVVDFGLVKFIDDDPSRARTRSGTTMGTPQYMAPEQIESARDVDARADIFALGAILYELVSGRRAYDGETHFEILKKVVSHEHVPLRELCPEAPDRMIAAVDAAMSDVSTRPDTAEALWAIWAGSDETLEMAASRPGRWAPEVTEKLASMAPSVLPSEVPSGSTSTETFADLDAPSALPVPTAPQNVQPIDLPPEERQRSRAPLYVLTVLVLSGAVLAMFFSLGVIGALTLTTSEETGPTEIVAPPVPDPIPEPPPPEPEPEPVPAQPEPEPVAPPPEPVRPKPDRPKPVRPPPEPTPEPTATATLAVDSDVGVSFIGADGKRHSAGSVPTGVYRVEVQFSTGTTVAGSIELTEGASRTVTCRDALSNCSF